MSNRRVSQFGPDELAALLRREDIDESTALEVLRNPHCSAEMAAALADKKHVLASHSVRQLLCSIHGFPFARAMNLIATLPWLPLLELVASPRTPPVVKRQAERKLLMKLPNMALGEKIAMARRAPRPFFKALIGINDEQVLMALLNNARLVENDILLMLNIAELGPDFCRELAGHGKWGQYHGVRKGMAVCPFMPLSIAFSVLVFLNRNDLRELAAAPNVRTAIKNAAEALIEKREAEKTRKKRNKFV